MGATAPATGVGLGKGAPDEVGEEAAEADAVAWGDGVPVVCAVELLPHPARTRRATSASPGWSLVTRPRILPAAGRQALQRGCGDALGSGVTPCRG